MPEDNPPENDLANRVAPEDMTQSLNTTAPTDMVVYEHKTEPQDEPNDVPPEVTARDTPQIIPQDVPENVQVHDQPRPDKGTSRESVSQEQVYGNNIPLVDEPVRQTGSRFTLRRTHPVDAHGRKSPGERDLTGETLTEESLTEGNLIEHTRAKLKLTDQSLTKKTHRSSSDRKDSHKLESRRSDPHRKDSHGRGSHKSSKMEESHKKKKIDATAVYGRPSFLATIGHLVDRTPYVRNPLQTKRKGN
ncbi:hypothetical protein BFJ68_g12843 [Fusarium oxysporum]|uniref:Uncharacterized protein n=1 Tax=Fusarium oxysporum TaxID=5507 RepID=A0A420Q5Y9_FUSOX|nr:hypothetical protein BFJ71_g8868 [Fusarium oxysporum]RKL00158.1 hypothetical protein BFJ68_g12843 [Fusarium oxysporum]